MLLPRLPVALLLAASATVQAFKDSYPFVLISNDGLINSKLQSSQLITSANLVKSLVSSCDYSKFYNIYIQPGLRSSDFASLPKIQSWIRSAAANSSDAVIEIPEVLNGGLDGQKIANTCMGSKDKDAHGLWFSEHVLSEEREAREAKLARIDSFIYDELRHHPSPEKPYVFILAGRRPTSQEMEPPYEMDEPYAEYYPHQDMKRDLSPLRRAENNTTDNPHSNLPLFEKYQFLSPPLFMGLSVFILLFVILYTALSAIAGLQVTYFAFSREFAQGGGPQKAQKQQ